MGYRNDSEEGRENKMCVSDKKIPFFQREASSLTSLVAIVMFVGSLLIIAAILSGRF